MSTPNQNPERQKFDTRDYIPVLLLAQVYNKRMLHAVAHRVVGHSAYRTFIECASDVFNQQVDRFGLPQAASMASSIAAFVNEQVYGQKIDVTKLDFYTYVYRFIYLRQAVEKIKTRTEEFVELLKISLAANGIAVNAFDKTVKIEASSQVAQQLQVLANQLAVENKIKSAVIHFSRLIHMDNPELGKLTVKVNKQKHKTAVKNSVNHRELAIELDPDDPEPDATVEKLVTEAVESAPDETYAISVGDKVPDFTPGAESEIGNDIPDFDTTEETSAA